MRRGAMTSFRGITQTFEPKTSPEAAVVDRKPSRVIEEDDGRWVLLYLLPEGLVIEEHHRPSTQSTYRWAESFSLRWDS